jgi:hypothetical protein
MTPRAAESCDRAWFGPADASVGRTSASPDASDDGFRFWSGRFFDKLLGQECVPARWTDGKSR